MKPVHVKICGVTSIDDALMCADLGASAIGLNFVPSSSRFVEHTRAKEIVARLKARPTKPLIVGVVADLEIAQMLRLKEDVGLECLQLHGNEPPSTLAPLLPHAYKAVRVASRADVDVAATYGGDHVLVDAKVGQALGGTGETFDWSLVTALARSRRLTLAGGLTPDNVAAAIRIVEPFCVDVASGVESAPGKKDRSRVEAFIQQTRSARP